jgi:hypothetical protein
MRYNYLKKQFKVQSQLRIMNGLCEICLESNVEVKFVKGKTVCSDCANNDSNK